MWRKKMGVGCLAAGGRRGERAGVVVVAVRVCVCVCVCVCVGGGGGRMVCVWGVGGIMMWQGNRAGGARG